jgi:hypothetical protein
MKSKQRDERKRANKKPGSNAINSRIVAAIRSGWCGADLDDIVRIVTATRSKARF